MSDLISRSRLIEEIKENQWGWFSREMLLLILENQPSVTDTNVGCKWIPCSERLPEHAGKYLVTTDGTFGIDVIEQDLKIMSGINRARLSHGCHYQNHTKESSMELIDKKPLIRHLVDWQMEQFAEVGHEREFNLLDLIIKGIENEPTVEAKQVVHAKWIDGCCSNCGAYVPTDSRMDFIDENDCKFCYECGADMRERK